MLLDRKLNNFLYDISMTNMIHFKQNIQLNMNYIIKDRIMYNLQIDCHNYDRFRSQQNSQLRM